MKIVINGCYGGFSLSAVGFEDYLNRKGLGSYFYVQEHVDGNYTFDEDYVRVSAEEADRRKGVLGMFEVLTEDTGERLTKAEMWPGNGRHPASAGSGRDVPRDDPALVLTVEGNAAGSSGRCAELRVVEIPDGVEWEIEEYDGIEWVAEAHRTWN